MLLLMTKGLGKVSGCAQRQIFKMLQAMVDEGMCILFVWFYFVCLVLASPPIVTTRFLRKPLTDVT